MVRKNISFELLSIFVLAMVFQMHYYIFMRFQGYETVVLNIGSRYVIVKVKMYSGIDDSSDILKVKKIFLNITFLHPLLIISLCN